MEDATESQSLTFLSLPYDIRFLIYQHLFPSWSQIYLQALRDNTIIAITADKTVATNILFTCRALHSEAAGYLYNAYLFNMIGRKADCLRSHSTFLATLRKHAREEVHIAAFTNGAHSDTMCISMYSGDEKMKILKSRRRGVETSLDDIRAEIWAERFRRFAWTRSLQAVGTLVSVLVLLAAVLYSF